MRLSCELVCGRHGKQVGMACTWHQRPFSRGARSGLTGEAVIYIGEG